MRHVLADLQHAADSQIILGIHLRQEAETRRNRPQLVRLPVVIRAMDAAPWRAEALHLLPLHVELDDLAVVPVEGTFELTQIRGRAGAIAADPDETATDREAARVVRLTNEVLQHLSGLPIEQVDPL